MIFVRPAHGEPIDSILRRFKKAVEKDGLMREIRAHEHFEPKWQKRRKKVSLGKRKHEQQRQP